MGLQALLDHCYEVFLKHSTPARITLLHPDSRYRSLLVARLINDPSLRTFYYALGPDDINVEALLYGMMHDLANQHPTFGRHLNMLPQDAWLRMDALASTFARDAAELHTGDFYLILDEYDRSDGADDIQDFLEQVVHHLPPHCHLVLNSRTLPRLPWVSLLARGGTVILLDEQPILRDFYGPPRTQGKHTLDVYALGPGYVLLDGQPIETWEGHLPRLLFFFALDRPVITRAEICQAFWPDLHTDQAVNVFHVTKRRLHKALNMDVLVHNDGYYCINPELVVTYDVIEYVTALLDARREDSPDRIVAWQRAVDMYRGPFLQGHSDRWIVSRRADFRAGYLDALGALAAYWLQQGRNEHALGLYQRALAEDTAREDLHIELMGLYARLGRRSEAAAHFQRLTEDLRKQGRAPSDGLRAFYSSMMR